jgi:aryl carrier-like protein
MYMEAKLPKQMVTIEMAQLLHNFKISAIQNLLFAMIAEVGVEHLDPSKMVHLVQEWKQARTMLQVAMQAMAVHVDFGATQDLMMLV